MLKVFKTWASSIGDLKMYRLDKGKKEIYGILKLSLALADYVSPIIARLYTTTIISYIKTRWTK